ncbi:MAG: hypothetical protein JXA33_00565 [Anaerolineae bacterium]|nr:hypothetical protein [Anaerolineae bacterium]
MVEHLEEETLYCHWHPKVETTLRCYQCNTPICGKCAQRTPVGYICRECKRGRKQRYEQARVTDYVIAGILSVILGFFAGFIPIIGWFSIFVSPLAGGLIAEIIWRAVGRRYGTHLWWIVAAGIVIGGGITFLSFYLGGFFALLWFGVHLFLAIGAASARLRLQ